MKFEELGLCAELQRAVTEEGYVEPTPIQAQAIPAILLGKDVMARAQTGTGKTAGFTLPLLQHLRTHANSSPSPAKHPVRALILTPTRELAAQVEESVRTYGRHLPLKSAVIFGGVNMDPQIKALRAGVEILVATPGRLLDHVHQKTVNLGTAEILVLDEADRMLDMGFLPDIKRILSLLPAKRQNLLFSATFSGEIKKLADQLLNAPVLIEATPAHTATETVTQTAYAVDGARKRELLTHLIKSRDWQQVLVFMRTKHGANRLAQQLARDGVNSAAIHGDKTQPARQQALDEFKQGEVRVLVATDVAARGLDIDQLPHVVNFELPHVPEDYVHRIGRTGRAGASGEAISLVSAEEGELLANIQRLLKREIPREIVPGFEPGQPLAAAPAEKSGRGRRASPRRETGTEKRTPPPARHGERRERAPAAPRHAEAAAPEPLKRPEPHKPHHHAARARKPVPALLIPPDKPKND